METGSATSLTIEQVHADLQTQLQHGSTATLSNTNLPSSRFWQLVKDTLSTDPDQPTERIVVAPPSQGGSVTLGSVSGDSFTVTGKLGLLHLEAVATVTVSVTANQPDCKFSLTPPATWTPGQAFWQFDSQDLVAWYKKLTGVELSWASKGKTKADALKLAGKLSYDGIYGVIESLYPSQTAQQIDAPISFDANGPAIDARADVVHTGGGELHIGPVIVRSPYFVARVSYSESADEEGLMLPTSSVAIGWQLKSQHPSSIDDFELYAAVSDSGNLLYVGGRYPKKGDALALNDILAAFFNTQIPKHSLPGPLNFLTNDVGLQSFSLSMAVAAPPRLLSTSVDIGTKADSKGWVIIGPDSDPMLALQEIHFRYSSVVIDTLPGIQSFTLGGTLKISKLLFFAEATYTTAGSDYAIRAEGQLQTADGMPLRFTRLIRNFGAPSVADVFADFFELGFSEVGAEIDYRKTGGKTSKTWSAYALADLDLKLFGRELLGLHNTFVRVTGSEAAAGQPDYAIAASGDFYLLGATLPVRIELSGAHKTFTVGPVSFTLGGIITWMVNIIHPSWKYQLPEPWNVLDSIGFSNLTLEFDIANKSVSLDTGLKADFGFISLSSVRLTYHKATPGSQEQGVIFAMKGKFLGMDIEVTTDDPDLKDGEMGWDLVNGKPIAVPGAGIELFRLEYLGIGQHVSFRDTRQLKGVGDVIGALEKNFRPSSETGNPLARMNDLVFDENSGWLLGTKFTVIEAVTLSAIFNDPVLYGLRIELGGPKVKALSGLKFEILYKRITDTIGLYHIDLRLPDAIRQLEFGEVSVTLPEIVVDIYTNGNFKLDVGFPYKLDFSRSCAVEVLPFVGFGGFYFGYLDGATSDKVPAVSDGHFNPVLVFGLGLSIGVGKTIEKGIFSAGATLTVEGILEGVLAWFNPDDKHRDTELFYAIQGTIALEGHIYGTIDFKVVKASVDVSAGAKATLAIQCYELIHIALAAHVSAKVKVKVLLVTINCSFSLEVHLEFTVGHASTPPWHVIEGGAKGTPAKRLTEARHPRPGPLPTVARSRKAARRLRAAQEPLMMMAAVRLPAPAAAPGGVPAVVATPATTTIHLQFRPFFTQSDQGSIANDDSTPPTDRARSVAMLFTADTGGHGEDTEFAGLAKVLLQRVVEARLAQKSDHKDRVSLHDLEVVTHQLEAGLHDPAFAYDQLTSFFTDNHIVFEIDTGHQTGAVEATFFPMFPSIVLQDWLTPQGGSKKSFVHVDYATDPRFMVDETYESAVDAYFATFSVSSESSIEKDYGPTRADASQRSGTSESMARYIFRDYFLMVTRAMVDAATRHLEAYPYTVPAGSPTSLEEIAAAMSATGDTFDENPTALTIATANLTATDVLDGAAVGATSITGVRYQANSDETLDDIATRFGVTVPALAAFENPDLGVANGAGPNMVNVEVQITLGDITYTTTNDSMDLALVAALFGVTAAAVKDDPGNSKLDFSGPFPAGIAIKVPGAKYYLREHDTLDGLAKAFETTLDTLATKNATLKPLVKPLSVWAIPPFKHTATAKDSLQTIAEQYVLSLAQLLDAGYGAAKIVKSGATLTIPYRPDMPSADLYTDLGTPATTTPISRSVSRFLMHGLRLPRIQPTSFDQMKPFYDNTGQQIDVPHDVLHPSGKPTDQTTYELEIRRDPAHSWITFKGGTADSGTYTYSAEDLAELSVFNQRFSPASLAVRPLALMRYVPNRFALKHVIHWQSPDGLAPITGTPGGHGEPNIWPFPDALLGRLQGPAPDHTGAKLGLPEATTLRFDLAVGRQEKPNTQPTYTPVNHFAWATQVSLGVARVHADHFGADWVANDYLLTGAAPADRDRLYALWTYMADPAYRDTAHLYLLCPADPASQGNKGLLSHNLVAATTAVLKTNLSTTTDAGASQGLAAGPTPTYVARIDQPGAFVKLLWECATVDTGGFYLEYTEKDTGKGLPDNLFDKQGQGSVRLLVLFESQRHTSAGPVGSQPPMLRLCNCAVLTDHLDLANAELVVEGTTYAVQENQSLDTVRTAMGFTTLGELVDINRNVKVLLRVGTKVTAGTGTTVEPGDSLATVARRVGVTPQAVATSIEADSSVLVPGALLQYAEGQMKLFSTGAPGAVGMEVTRDNPDPSDKDHDQLTSQQKLDLMFNLLGIDLVGNTFFEPKAMTSDSGAALGNASEWPPAGPVVPADVSEATRDNTWLYRKIVQSYPLAKPAYNHARDVDGLPPAKDNPYAGLAQGSEVTFAYHLQDNFGNRTDVAQGIPDLTMPLGYRDHLQPYSAWPGVNSSFRIRPIAQQPSAAVHKVELEIDSGFRVTSYVSGNGQSFAQARKRLKAAREKLFRIYFQVLQPDYQTAVSTSLDTPDSASEPAMYYVSKSPFTDVVNASLLFLGQLLELPEAPCQISAGDTLTRIDETWLLEDPGAFLKANGRLTVGRVFKLGSSAPDDQLTIPVTFLARAGQSLVNLAAAATSAMGTTVTEDQVATLNEKMPLAAGTAATSPTRTLPPGGAPPIGDASLQDLADKYRTTVTQLASSNKAAQHILRAGTTVSHHGLDVTIGSTDTFTTLATAFMQIAVTAGLDTFQKAADARRLSVGALAAANASTTGLFVDNAPFTYPDGDGKRQTVHAKTTDSLYDIAQRFITEKNVTGITVESLVDENKNTTGLLADKAQLSTGLHGVTPGELAVSNARLAKLFAASAQVKTTAYVLADDDTLAGLVKTFEVLDPGYTLARLVRDNRKTGNLFPAGAQLLAGTKAITPDAAETIDKLVGDHKLTHAQLGRFNPTKSLNEQTSTFVVPERTVSGGLSTSTVQPAAGKSLADVASLYPGTSAATLVETNFAMWRTLSPGRSINYGGTTVVTIGSDSFASLWQRLKGTASPDYAGLATSIDAADALRPGAVLTGPLAKNGGTAAKPSILAATWNVGAEDLLHANRSLTGFVNPGVSVAFPRPDGSGTTDVRTRTHETVNTFFSLARRQPGLEKLRESAFIRALTATDRLIAASTPLVLPPVVEHVTTRINRDFPQKIFRVTSSIRLLRVDFQVTTSTIAALKQIPDITAAQADRLAAMATAGTRYTDGDAFDAELRKAFGTQPDLEYLIGMARRYAALPSVLIDPSFQDVRAVRRADSLLPAHADPSPQDREVLSLKAFAEDFETAFDQQVKVGVSAADSSSDNASDTTETPRKLWAIDFSSDGYGVTVDPKPSFFARKPIVNRLLDEDAVPMRHYVSGNSTLTDAHPVDVKNANLDEWAKQFFAALDLMLSPAYAVPAHQQAGDSFQALVGIKKSLADKVSSSLDNLLKAPAPPGTLAPARAAYADRLRTRLSDAYAIETVLQFPARITNGDATDAPRLFGQPRNLPYTTRAAEDIASMATALKVSADYLVERIADMPGILNVRPAGETPVTVTCTPTGRTATPTANDSLSTLAVRLGITGDDPALRLIGQLTVAPAGQGLFAPALPINVTSIAHKTKAAQSIEATAFQLDVSVRQLAEAMQNTPGLFNPTAGPLKWDGKTVGIDASSTLVSLAAAFTHQGVSPSPSPVDVANYFRREPDDLVVSRAQIHLVEILPNYNLSNAKIPLTGRDSTLTFFLDVANEAAAKKFFMNLDYVVNQVEHDIRSNPADPDYEDSSWINFLIPFDSAASRVNTNIGRTEIPIANENYPDIPILNTQGGVPTKLPGPNPSLNELKEWDYFYEFEYREAAQDVTYTGITINDVSVRHNAQAMAMLAVSPHHPTNILEALAQFDTNYQPLMEDLGQLPFLKPGDKNDAAVSAVKVFQELAAQIEAMWGNLPHAGNVSVGATVANTGGEHDFSVITTLDRLQRTQLDTLVFKPKRAGETIWPGQVEVLDNGTWKKLTLDSQAGDLERVFTYPSGISADRQLRHRVYFNQLDVIVSQSADAHLEVTRNESLSYTAATADAFVYRTPRVNSPNMFTPLIERSKPYLMPVPPAPNDHLTGALSKFFEELFDIGRVTWPQGTTRLIKLHASYRFELVPGQSLTGNLLTPLAPAILHTQYTFKVNPSTGKPDYDPTTGTFVSNVSLATSNWMAANLDQGQAGYLAFEVVVFEEKSDTNPSPVLKLHNLLWKLQ